LLLHLADEFCVMGEDGVVLFQLLVLSLLGEHEGAELLELTFKVLCVLLLLELAEVSLIHRLHSLILS
jgi:hypothetical protein